MRSAVCLFGVMHTAEIVSLEGFTLRRLSPWRDSHCRDCLHGGMHTAEIVSQRDAHCGDCLGGVRYFFIFPSAIREKENMFCSLLTIKSAIQPWHFIPYNVPFSLLYAIQPWHFITYRYTVTLISLLSTIQS